jgi:hypothetical protein
MGDDVVLVVNNWARGKSLKDQGVCPFFTPEMSLNINYIVYKQHMSVVSDTGWGVLDSSHNHTNRPLLA